MKVNNNGVVYIKALDGSILRLEEVEGYYNIGAEKEKRNEIASRSIL